MQKSVATGTLGLEKFGTNDLVLRLRPKERRGSKPRCHLLTHGVPREVAARLSALAAPFAEVSSSDRWMPVGFANTEEAQLHKAERLLDVGIRNELRTWWLAPASERALTPNFDIASTCTIQGRPGLLLVEAKAYDEELNKARAGRVVSVDDSEERKASHKTIATAIASACDALANATSRPWGISRESHYQMSNRFAWSWKLTTLGVPVVLVYLGFLRAMEMQDRGKPFATHAEWESIVRNHSQSLFPADIWDQCWMCEGQPFVPLIRSLEVSLN